ARLAQITVRVGTLRRAEQALTRALDVRSPLQFMRETTGGVFDTLEQIHLVRGNPDEANRCLQRSREAYGDSKPWYQWSVQVLEARLALRRGDPAAALAAAGQIADADDALASYVTQRERMAAEALLASGRRQDAETRLTEATPSLSTAGISSAWGEFL